MIMASHYLKNNQGERRDNSEVRKELYLLTLGRVALGLFHE